MTQEEAEGRLSAAFDLLNTDRADLAEVLVRDVLAADPDNADAHRALGDCLRELGDLEGALRELDESLRIEPDAPLTHLDRGRLLHLAGKFKQAEAEVRESLRLGPPLPAMYVVLSWVLRDRGDLPGAERAARIGLEVDARNIDCLASLALTLMLRHRFHEASETLRGALAGAPERADLHNTLGIELLHRSLFYEAELEFAEALRLNPTLESAEQNLKLAIQGRKGKLMGPYGLRLAFEWQHLRPQVRLAATVAPIALGFLLPIAWGLGLVPLLRELIYQGRAARLRGPLRDVLVTLAFFGIIGVLGLFSAARTGYLGERLAPASPASDATWQPPPTIDFLHLLQTDAAGQVHVELPPAILETRPAPEHQMTQAELDFARIVGQAIVGLFLFVVIQPALMTTGRPRRVALLLTLAASLVAVAGMVISSATNSIGADIGALLGISLFATITPRVAFRLEQAEFR